jgi:hypothetical protein
VLAFVVFWMVPEKKNRPLVGAGRADPSQGRSGI